MLSSDALASKQAVDFFGGSGGLGGQFSAAHGVAVNDTGVGPASAGDVYVTDGRSVTAGNRILRFGRDDGGTPGNTPADTVDDSYFFISAWGADVIKPGAPGDTGSGYEICTVAADCQPGTASGANGSFDFTNSSSGKLAVDPDTGDVYVSDSSNNRVSVYSGTGTFLRSFGRDVVASGPGNAGSGYEVCVAANGDSCKAGTAGSGIGQLDHPAAIAVSPDGNAASGTIYVADPANQRVSTYGLDGTSPAAFGSAQFAANEPREVAVDSRAIVYADNRLNAGQIERYDSANANGGGIGFLDPLRSAISEQQELDRNATAGQYRLTFNGDTTSDLAFNASKDQVDAALEALPSIGAGNVVVNCGCPGGQPIGPYTITFDQDLANTDVSQLVVSAGTTPFSGGSIAVSTVQQGFANGGVNERQDVAVSATAGTFKLSFDPDGAGPRPAETTVDLPFDVKPRDDGNDDGLLNSVQDALVALPSVPKNSVAVAPIELGRIGLDPYVISFKGALGAMNQAQLTCSNGATPLSGGSGCSVDTAIQGQGGLLPVSSNADSATSALAVDPDSDGAGPDSDVLYVGRSFDFQAIQQFGPINTPGLTAPPATEDDRHGTFGVFKTAGLGVEPTTGRLYAAGDGDAGPGVYVLDQTGPPPTATVDSCDNLTPTSADCHATVDPNGPPATHYHFEYSADGQRWTSLPDGVVGIQQDPQPVSQHIEPLPFGLDPNTSYQVRIVVGRRFAEPVTSDPLTLTTADAPPLAETNGAPVRSASTAQLNGRVTPLGNPTSFHFEYGSLGPCSANPCASTAATSAGNGQLTRFVGAKLSGLDPGTTYHYRLVADNGVGAPVAGADMTVATRSSDELSGQSDQFPGPPDSDRAWELVSASDTSGNPAASLFYPAVFSDNGERALYSLSGGSPVSSTGFAGNPHFAQRTPAGWQTKRITPARDQLVGGGWYGAYASGDLSTVLMANNNAFGNGAGGTDIAQIWRANADSSPSLLLQTSAANQLLEPLNLSRDGTRALAFLQNQAFDPQHPTTLTNLYELGPASPRLVSLLPGGAVGPCGVVIGDPFPRSTHWLSDDGSRAIFATNPSPPCSGPDSVRQLYVRDLVSDQTTWISGPALSGLTCEANLLNSTPTAVFFSTRTRLASEDLEPSGCASAGGSGSGAAGGSNDIYRFDLSSGDLACLTCVIPGFNADVVAIPPLSSINVSDDGSRIYFASAHQLVRGAPTNAIYRLDVDSGSLAYVLPSDQGIGLTQTRVVATPDGANLAVASAEALLNPIGGTSDNAGTRQFYLYDDGDGSVVCVTCPQDGSAPLANLSGDLNNVPQDLMKGLNNTGTLSADGETLAFASVSPLVSADQNTGPSSHRVSGEDVYEWRDGRLLLVTDGKTSWAGDLGVTVLGITPSGRDIFFSAAAAYTADAIDALPRFYDARIGGGFHFPEPPPPCSLEDCQGPASPAPADPGSGSSAETDGNLTPPPDCSRAEAALAKAKKRLHEAKGHKARARARKAVKKAKKKLAKCQGGQK